MKLLQKEIDAFQEEILEWYKKNKRNLSWRDVPVATNSRSGASFRDPYAILVSEVMLQQTQVSRVIPKFEEWMKAFPTVEKLAKATTRDVLHYWSGLGYNRRALFLQKTAKKLVSSSFIVDSKRDKASLRGAKRRSNLIQDRHATLAMTILWPQTEEELRKLPGIGEYTARAILCFAFNQQVAVVDTNVRKVILLKFLSGHPEFISGSQSGGKKKEVRSKKMLKQVQHDKKTIQEIADELLPQGKAYEWNQALMDYASAMLKKEKIPVARQSHFKTSKRFYRGQVVRLLLKQKETMDSLFEKIGNNGITKKEFEEILKDMEKEELVKKEGRQFAI